MAAEQEQIKELVKERYGARADRVISLTSSELRCDHSTGCGCSTDTVCCGPTDLDHAMILYLSLIHI